jgi:hypothetical protein
MLRLLPLFVGLACAAPAPKPAEGIHLTPEQAQDIGKKLWQNEAGGKVQFLTHWNEGEDFASLGIGHFIWYHEGAPGPFTESFPHLVAYLKAQGVSLPNWLQGPCPWKSKDEFFTDFHSPKMDALRQLLVDTVPQQAMFAAKRLEDALPKMLADLPDPQKDLVKKRFYAVAADPDGVYALVDYVNFKGEGTSLTERYNGQGWGLLQVLQEMRDAQDGYASVQAFAFAADTVLTRRVTNAPAMRHEELWLPGWRKRLKTYASRG